MSKWIIDKEISFCYGHRVWTQQLNAGFSNNLKCACRHLHGHEGSVRISLTGPALDNTGMVTDFRHLEWVKKFIDQYIDHHFIYDVNDPIYNTVIGDDKPLMPVEVDGHIAGYIIDMSLMPENLDNAMREYYEGMFFVGFPPTSEKLSEWLANLVDHRMKQLNVAVERVEWWETPKSRSIYYMPTAQFSEDGKRV